MTIHGEAPRKRLGSLSRRDGVLAVLDAYFHGRPVTMYHQLNLERLWSRIHWMKIIEGRAMPKIKDDARLNQIIADWLEARHAFNFYFLDLMDSQSVRQVLHEALQRLDELATRSAIDDANEADERGDAHPSGEHDSQVSSDW